VRLGKAETLYRLSISSHIIDIQGSGTGPLAYIFNTSDLHTIFPSNILLKYADDTYSVLARPGWR